VTSRKNGKEMGEPELGFLLVCSPDFDTAARALSRPGNQDGRILRTGSGVGASAGNFPTPCAAPA
jgi:hypothetical protein